MSTKCIILIFHLESNIKVLLVQPHKQNIKIITVKSKIVKTRHSGMRTTFLDIYNKKSKVKMYSV